MAEKYKPDHPGVPLEISVHAVKKEEVTPSSPATCGNFHPEPCGSRCLVDHSEEIVFLGTRQDTVDTPIAPPRVAGSACGSVRSDLSQMRLTSDAVDDTEISESEESAVAENGHLGSTGELVQRPGPL